MNNTSNSTTIPVSFGGGKIWNIKVNEKTAQRWKEITKTPEETHKRYVKTSGRPLDSFPEGCKCTSCYFCDVCYKEVQKTLS
jgi:hypothetical protein